MIHDRSMMLRIILCSYVDQEWLCSACIFVVKFFLHRKHLLSIKSEMRSITIFVQYEYCLLPQQYDSLYRFGTSTKKHC